MKFKILAAVGVGLALLLPLAAFSRVKDTPHKLTGTLGIAVPNAEVCRPCHTPHNASTEVGYIWNHALSAGGWTLHSGADAASVFNGESRLCLSCHDATVALDSYGGLTGTVFITGSQNLGTDLSNDHPVGVDYPTADPFHFNPPDVNGDIVDPVETPAGMSAHVDPVDLTVQCTSCHFAHGSRAPYGMFLRVDNTNSALCMTCHVTPG